MQSRKTTIIFIERFELALCLLTANLKSSVAVYSVTPGTNESIQIRSSCSVQLLIIILERSHCPHAMF